MNKVVVAMAFVVAGCATQIIDRSAWPAADARRSVAADQCVKAAEEERRLFGRFRMVNVAICDDVATRTFFQEIKLTRMDFFEAYATKHILISTMYDEGRLTADEFTAENKKIGQDLWDAIDYESQRLQDERERQAAALAAFGESLQDAGRAMDGNQVNCTSVRTGNITNTSCR